MIALMNMAGLSGDCGRSARFGIGLCACATLLAAGVTPAASQPEVDRIYADCKLDGDTFTALQNSIRVDPRGNNPNIVRIENPVVSYVVVYAIQNDNNGQEVTQDDVSLGFTGVVVCTPEGVSISDPNAQTEDIPLTGTIDILDLQNSLILRHAPNAEAENGGYVNFENRWCHTTDEITECFDILPQ